MGGSDGQWRQMCGARTNRCTERWGGVCALGGGGGVWDDGWLRGLRADCGWVRDRHTHRESKQATQVAVSQKPACVCCWPLHISTTLPQFVFCVLWPQMNFLPPSFFFPHTIPFKMLPPHQKHTQTHTPAFEYICTQTPLLQVLHTTVAYAARPTKSVCGDTDSVCGVTTPVTFLGHTYTKPDIAVCHIVTPQPPTHTPLPSPAN